MHYALHAEVTRAKKEMLRRGYTVKAVKQGGDKGKALSFEVCVPVRTTVTVSAADLVGWANELL